MSLGGFDVAGRTVLDRSSSIEATVGGLVVQGEEYASGKTHHLFGVAAGHREKID